MGYLDGNCCDATSCTLKSSGSVCRAAVDSCDEAEVCDGSSVWCPSDDGKVPGTSCTISGVESNCYRGACLASPNAQCVAMATSENPYTTACTYSNALAGNTCQRRYCLTSGGACGAFTLQITITGGDGTQQVIYPTYPIAGSQEGIQSCEADLRSELTARHPLN